MTIGKARQAIADSAARAELYRLWHLAHRTGATHQRSLEMMGPRDRSESTESFRRALLDGARRRQTLAATLEANARLAQPLEVALLSFGEESGGLEQALKTLSIHFESEHRLLRRVWSKLTYPLISSLLAIFIVALPILVAGDTRGYVVTVAVGVALWYGFGGGAIVALATFYARKREFVLARFARALATGIEAGLPLDRVVVLAAEVSQHPDIIAHVRRFSAQQLATQSLSDTFQGSSVLPPEMQAAIKVGEVSSDFSGALARLADLYDPL